MARTTFITALSLFASAVLARTADYTLKISNGKIAPDGVERVATLVNGGYPGPLISANKGDTLKIKVQNNLTDPSMYRTTSIHWHGLLQHRNADDDGPAWVTQCPIVPQESYTYTMPLGDQTGTYWYHSHLSSQYVDGLRGPLVIYDPKDPHRGLYDVDDEKTVLIIGDWFHDSSKDILASRNITRQRPVSATINGKGRFNPDNTPANPDTLYALKVKRGKRYRLRVINASAIASFRFSVQGHKFTVIAADGVSTKPYKVDSFDILAGQRIDAIMEANQDPDTYWVNAPLTNVPNMTAQALIVYEEDRRPYHPPKGSYRKWSVSEAILKYWKHKHGHGPRSGHGVHKARMLEIGHNLHARKTVSHHDIVRRQEEATTNQTATVVMDESKLAPLEYPGAACGSKPDLVLDLTFGVNFATGDWMINGIPYKSPSTPTLLKILTDVEEYYWIL